MDYVAIGCLMAVVAMALIALRGRVQGRRFVPSVAVLQATAVDGEIPDTGPVTVLTTEGEPSGTLVGICVDHYVSGYRAFLLASTGVDPAGNMALVDQAKRDGVLFIVPNESPVRVEKRESGLVKLCILDGPQWGRLCWTTEGALHTRDRSEYLANRASEEAGRHAEAARKKLEERAESLRRHAVSLEYAGKARGALSLYRQIIKDFANTPQADEGRRKIQAIEGKM